MTRLATRSRLRSWTRLVGTWVLVVAGLLLLWQAVIAAFGIRRYLLPPPVAVIGSIRDNLQLLLRHTWITAGESLAGLCLALAVGTATAALLARWSPLRRIVMPGLVAFNAVPKVALAPILLVWLGLGYSSKVAMAFLLAVFPIIVNTTAGLRDVEPALMNLARLLGASGWQQFRMVRIPNALPSIFTALKIATPLAIVGALVAEFLAPSRGLGHLIVAANTQLRTDLVYAAVVMVVAFSLILYGAVVALERSLLRWNPALDDTGEASQVARSGQT